MANDRWFFTFLEAGSQKDFMKVSVCLTIYNEEKSVRKLLESLLGQTKKSDEIVIVDGGSTDKTVEIIRHLQKKDKRIKLLVQKSTRAEGRNIGVDIAKYDIIAITDADCRADKNWLKRITEPFKQKEIDIAAGFYKMTANTPHKKAISIFLGVTPRRFGINFLPSTRSIAFRKSAWVKVGGFPERARSSAEDTEFNYRASKLGLKFARVKTAIVEWGMPETVGEGLYKLYIYAKWDAWAMIWWNPGQKLASHNIKISLIFLRYLVGTTLLISAFSYPLLWLVLGSGLFLYILWAFRKVYMEYQDFEAGLWGIFLQFAADFAVMGGFIKGSVRR